jgi:hypothetical protein
LLVDRSIDRDHGILTVVGAERPPKLGLATTISQDDRSSHKIVAMMIVAAGRWFGVIAAPLVFDIYYY